MVNFKRDGILEPFVPGGDTRDKLAAAQQAYAEMEARKRQALYEKWQKEQQVKAFQQQQMQQQEQQQQQNPLEDLYRMLAEKMGQRQQYSPIYMGMSPEQMQERANSLVSAQYDPQIEAIQRMMGETQTRADRNKAQIGDMYNALSQAYSADVPKVQQMYDDARSQAVTRQQDLQNNLNADYQARQDSVNQKAAALGQQAAAAEATQPIQNDQAFLTNLANQVSEQNVSNLDLLKNANVAYTQQGATLAGLEGSNRQADLMTQLEDYLRNQQGNIEGLQNQRQSDYAKYLSDLQMQDMQGRNQDNQFRAQFEAQQSAQDWQQLMDIAGIRMKMDGGGPSLQDLIAADRLGFDKDQASAALNGKMFEYAMQLVDQQGMKFEDALKFVQAALTQGR